MEFLKDFNQKLFFQYTHYIKKKKKQTKIRFRFCNGGDHSTNGAGHPPRIASNHIQ